MLLRRTAPTDTDTPPVPALPPCAAAYGIVCAAVDTRTNQQARRRLMDGWPAAPRGRPGASVPTSAPLAPKALSTSLRSIFSPLPCTQQVAIKKIGDIFANPLDARRTLREIQARAAALGLPPSDASRAAAVAAGSTAGRQDWPVKQTRSRSSSPQILRHVRGHSNVITLLDLFPPSAGLHDFRRVPELVEAGGGWLWRGQRRSAAVCPEEPPLRRARSTALSRPLPSLQ